MPLGLQQTYRLNMEPALAGLTVEEIRSAVAINRFQGTAQVDTIVITAVADGNTATISKLGQPPLSLLLNSVTGASVTAARNALVVALKASYSWSSRYAIAASSTDSITLTDRYPNVVTPVATFTGSGTTTGTSSVTTAASPAVATPYGLVVASPATPSAYVDGIPVVAVPSASTDVPQGIVRASHTAPTIGFNETANSNPIQRTFTILKQGIIWAVSEAVITAEDTTLFFRHTADGALTTLGAIAPATGTGLAAFTGATAKGDSVLLDDGTYVTPVYIDLA